MNLEKLRAFLIEGGAGIEKTKIKYFTEAYRGISAKFDIKKGEMISVHPFYHTITLEMCKKGALGKKIYNSSAYDKLNSPDTAIIACFLLQEQKRPDSLFKPMLEILPPNWNEFPTHYSKEEIAALGGTFFAERIAERIEAQMHDFKVIKEKFPQEFDVDFEGFKAMRTAVSSRNFLVNTKEGEQNIMVLWADMFNHSTLKRGTSWRWSISKNCFEVKAVRDIKKGEEIFHSYGNSKS